MHKFLCDCEQLSFACSETKLQYKLNYGRGTPYQNASTKLQEKFGAFIYFVTIFSKIDAKPPH